MSYRSHLGRGVSRSVCLAAASVVTLIGASAVSAADKDFVGTTGTPTDYNTGANWSPVGVPGGSDKAFVNGGRIATITGPTLTLDSASIGADGPTRTGSGELRLASGSLSIAGGIQLGHDSGTAGFGLITITGGTLTAGQNVVMGEQGTGANAINISGGTLNLNGENYLGANGTGTLAISGASTVVNAQRLNIGNGPNSSGTFTMSGGTLNEGNEIYVGLRGLGSWTQTGGTANVKRMQVGQENDGPAGGPSGDGKGRGIVTVSAGTLASTDVIVLGEQSREDNQLNVSGTGTVSSTGDILVGANGRGTFNFSGGTVTIGNQLHIGASGTGVGAMTMTGGTLNIQNVADAYLLVGQNGTGTYNQSAGDVTTAIFSVGQDPTGFGTATHTGGTIRSRRTLVVGETSSSNNVMSTSGGSIDIGTAGFDPNGNGIFVGSGKGKGTLNVSGTANVSSRSGVTIGLGEGGVSDGTINVSGGTFKTVTAGEQGRVRIGVFGGTTGRLNVTGGTVTFAGPILNGVAKDSAGTGIVGGTGLVTVGGGSLTSVGLENLAGSSFTQTAGTSTLGTVSGNGALSVSGGTSNVSRITQQSLSVTGTGTVKVAVGDTRTASVVSTLTTGGTGKLDLSNNGLVIDYTGATSPITSVRDALKAGQIVGTLPVADPRQGLGYANTNAAIFNGTPPRNPTSLFGTPVDSTAVIVRTVLRGDADLSGNVNFDDLVPLAQNYNTNNHVWTEGDFTYDGVVNFDDLVPLAQNYNASVALLNGLGSAEFQSDWALAQALVPEPTTLIGLVAASGLASRRRRL